MLRWTRPGVPVSFERTKRSDYPPDRAGIRCKELVLASREDAKIAVWTIIATDQLTEKERRGAKILGKDEKPASKVIEALR